MTEAMTVWAWFCEAQHTYLFRGNPNEGLDYHLGGITDVMYGMQLVFAAKKWVLEESHNSMREWNEKFPQLKVKPVRVTITIAHGGGKAKGGAK